MAKLCCHPSAGFGIGDYDHHAADIPGVGMLQNLPLGGITELSL